MAVLATTEGLPVDSGGVGGSASTAPGFVDQDGVRRMVALRGHRRERRHADADEADLAVANLPRRQGDEADGLVPGAHGAFPVLRPKTSAIA